MNKRAKDAAIRKPEVKMPIEQTPSPAGPTSEDVSTLAVAQGADEDNGTKAASKTGTAAPLAETPGKDPIASNPHAVELVEKLLTEGSTFEVVVDTARERNIPGVTLNAVKTYFQGNRELQAKRVHYMVDTSESLMKSLGNPDSAEARLAKAALMTGFMNLHEGATPISLKDAEHARMERANLALKHKLVVSQRDKARQALRFTEERMRLLVLSQQKVKQHMDMLQQDAKRQQAGEPLGPAMLQRIQQIYGLTCQMPDGGRGDAAKA